MNPFKSDTAPYVATLLISALGWLLTTLHGEIQSSAIIAYEMKVSDKMATLEIRNISNSAAIQNASIALICPQVGSCLTPMSVENKTPHYGAAVRLPPTGDVPVIHANDSSQIAATVNLPVGGRTRLVTGYAGGPPQFYFFQGDAPVQVVEARSLKGLFIAHYGQFLGGLFIFTVGALCAWLGLNLFTRSKKATPDAPQPLNVVLSLANADGND